jgi:MYXO-CTERM domain-containing protein
MPKFQMSSFALRLVPPLAIVAISLFAPGRAHAHFTLNTPASWMSQDPKGSPQKFAPCAPTPDANLGELNPGTATMIVSPFQPGQMVSVSVTATQPHPGWYRIALAEGASSMQTTMTLPDPKAQAGTTCTPAIMTNPVWSTTQPVLADGLPAGSTAMTQQTGTKTFQVSIPQTASCTSARPCTLQVIMVMTDHPVTDCYYHHCADIMVSGTPVDGGVATTGAGGATGSGGTAGKGGATGAGGSSATGTGGTTGSTTGTGGQTGGSGSGGATATGAAGAAGTGTGTGTGGSSTSGAGGETGGGTGAGNSSSSSGCAVAGASSSTAALSLMLLLVFARRRRKTPR